MQNRIRTACRAAAVAIALVAAGGAAAVPAAATSAGTTQTAPAPAPTGLTYSYDAATEQVTVRWDPKDPADTVTTGYRDGTCAGPSPETDPCFVRRSGPLLTGDSLTFPLGAGRISYFRLYAENAAHQLTGSAILTITT